MSQLWAQFFSNQQILESLWLGALIAAVAALVGVFVILRSQAFAGHVLTDIGVTGASGAYLAGISAWYGFLSFGLIAGESVETLGDRAQNRDIATGIILSFAMGLGALFLYLDARVVGNTSASQLVLFGSLFAMNQQIVIPIVIASLVAIVLTLSLYRPLLLSSISPEVARAKGVPVRFIGFLFMAALAIAVEDSSLLIGALMSTALLVGPAYTATKLTTKPYQTIILAVCISVITMWLGVILAFASTNWPPYGHGWPVSFFIAALVILPVLLISLRKRWRQFSLRSDLQ